MNNAIQTILLEKNKPVGFLLIGLSGMSVGIILSMLLKVNYIYLFLAEVALLIFMVAALTRNVKRFLLTLLIITIPININKDFFHSSSHIGGITGIAISVWFLALIGLYVIWFFEYQQTKEKIQFFPYAVIPLIFLMLANIFSLGKAEFLSLSGFQIFQLSKVMFLIFYIANNIKTEKEYKFVLYVLLATFLIELCIGYYQRAVNEYVDLGILADGKPHKHRLIGGQRIMSVTGTLGTGAIFGDFLAMLLAVILANLSCKGKWVSKSIYTLLFSSGLVLMIFTFTRGIWLGFGIGIVLFIILKLISARGLSRGYLKIILVVILTTVVIFAFQDLILSRIFGEDHGSAHSRVPMMKIAYEIIKSNPILGVGANNYSQVMESYDPVGLSYVWHQPVHNVFIQLAAEIGLPGFLFFMLFIASLYGYSIKYILISNEFLKYQLIGLIVGITALLIHGMVNNATIATDPFILFWLYGGLILAIVKLTKNQEIVTETRKH